MDADKVRFHTNVRLISCLQNYSSSSTTVAKGNSDGGCLGKLKLEIYIDTDFKITHISLPQNIQCFMLSSLMYCTFVVRSETVFNFDDQIVGKNVVDLKIPVKNCLRKVKILWNTHTYFTTNASLSSLRTAPTNPNKNLRHSRKRSQLKKPSHLLRVDAVVSHVLPIVELSAVTVLHHEDAVRAVRPLDAWDLQMIMQAWFEIISKWIRLVPLRNIYRNFENPFLLM